MGRQWPMVGRAGELRRLQSLTDSGARGLVLAGQAGVGKTRLAAEYVQQLERAGMAVTTVIATRAASALPLGAFTPLLPALRDVESAGVNHRADLLRRCASFLVASAGDRHLALFVDDAHLLDDASAALVHQMAGTGTAFVVATIRSAEPAPDPIVALWKNDAVERIDITGLPADSVEELLLAALGGPVDRATVQRLSVGSQGNVLFLRELVLGALEDGTLHNDVGIWRLVGPVSPSSRLTELVQARFQGQSDAERDLLELLAVGEPLGSAELRSLSDPALADPLERRGSIASEFNGRRLHIRLGHPLYGDVLRAEISAIRQREIARRLAEAVEATGARRREDVLRVATWRLDGGGAKPESMLRGAWLARWRHDVPLADRLARAAIQAGAGFEAALLAAQLASLQGRGVEAERELASLAARAIDDRQRGLVACTRLDNHAIRMGHFELGLQMAKEAEASINDPAWRDEIAAKRAAIVYGQQGPRAGAKIAEPLLQRSRGRAFVWASILTAYSSARLGRLAEARVIAQRGYEAQLSLSEPFDWDPCAHIFFQAEALAHAGRIEEAEALAREQYQRAVADKSPEAQAWFAWQLTKLVVDRGSPKTAAVYGRAAAALFRQLGWVRYEHFVLGHLALALALGGEPDAAEQCLEQLDGLGLPPARYWAVDVFHARAWARVARGDLPSALPFLKQAIETGEDLGDAIGEAAALHALARLGYPEEAGTRLEALADRVDGDLVAARACHVSALQTADPVALEEVSAKFEAMGALLLAAEAAADASAAWRSSGDSRRAARTEQRASLLAARCEHPVTPTLQAIRSRSRLTRAERETAVLAAAGQANKEIAQQLGISVRTVENHLQHVYEKVGISSRSELAARLESAH